MVPYGVYYRNGEILYTDVALEFRRNKEGILKYLKEPTKPAPKGLKWSDETQNVAHLTSESFRKTLKPIKHSIGTGMIFLICQLRWRHSDVMMTSSEYKKRIVISAKFSFTQTGAHIVRMLNLNFLLLPIRLQLIFVFNLLVLIVVHTSNFATCMMLLASQLSCISTMVKMNKNTLEKDLKTLLSISWTILFVALLNSPRQFFKLTFSEYRIRQFVKVRKFLKI